MRSSTEGTLITNPKILSTPTDEIEKKNLVTINSRFGKIKVDRSKKITFKHGILGIPKAVSFCLTKLPNISSDQFKLLQCLEDEELSFIVVPSQYDNQLIETKDLDEACKVLDIDTKNLILLFIVTINDDGTNREVSVNAKAPILIDALNRNANQYVLQNPTYKIQHKIS
jgi:flagellar assembly factor FliW